MKIKTTVNQKVIVLENTKMSVIEKLWKKLNTELPNNNIEFIPIMTEVEADIIVSTQSQFIGAILKEVAPEQITQKKEADIKLMMMVVDEAKSQGLDVNYITETCTIEVDSVYSDFIGSQTFNIVVKDGEILIVHYNENYGTMTYKTNPNGGYDFDRKDYEVFTPQTAINAIKETVEKLNQITKIYETIPLPNVD